VLLWIFGVRERTLNSCKGFFGTIRYPTAIIRGGISPVSAPNLTPPEYYTLPPIFCIPHTPNHSLSTQFPPKVEALSHRAVWGLYHSESNLDSEGRRGSVDLSVRSICSGFSVFPFRSKIMSCSFNYHPDRAAPSLLWGEGASFFPENFAVSNESCRQGDNIILKGSGRTSCLKKRVDLIQITPGR